jgi:hypothetical protein
MRVFFIDGINPENTWPGDSTEMEEFSSSLSPEPRTGTTQTDGNQALMEKSNITAVPPSFST